MTNYLNGITAKEIKNNPMSVFQSIAKEISSRQFETITNGKDNVKSVASVVDFDSSFPELKPIGRRETSRTNLINAAKSLNKRG
jgi:hypothetical protein